ncbi:hypothetical protein BKA70DRAFT_1428181 [Coprinopsis sp. MPI-PUGE-AT-0042]|nr:hypothetical protein BKA70DRAFT_1428181 [Coprinopsis sp. MPI-PUGE-AT-0042]
MGHHRWTDDHEGALDFLSDMLPEYLRAQEQKKPLKDGFYRVAAAKFKAKFPQIPTSEEVQKYGQEQAQEVVDKRLFGRICQWFPNNTWPGSRVCRLPKFDSPAPQTEKSESSTTTRHSRQKFSQSCIRIMPAKRKLQPLQAYSRLFYKDEVRDAYLAARDAYVEECKKANVAPTQEIAFRNQWLKERLEAESEEVKRQVEEYRETESKETVEDEDGATKNARFARNIPKLPKTLQGICQSIHDETGFAVSITVGGPHPMYGGKVVTLSRHFGKTHSGQTYEEFVGESEYDHQLALFDDFLHEKFDESDCQEQTLETKEGPVHYHEVEEASDDEGEDNESDETGEDGGKMVRGIGVAEKATKNSDVAAPTPKRSATGQLSEYELARQKNIAENEALLASLGLDGGASKKVLSTSSTLCERSKKSMAKDSGEDQSTAVAENDGSREECFPESSSSPTTSHPPSPASPTSDGSKDTPKPVVEASGSSTNNSEADASTEGREDIGVGADTAAGAGQESKDADSDMESRPGTIETDLISDKSQDPAKGVFLVDIAVQALTAVTLEDSASSGPMELDDSSANDPSAKLDESSTKPNDPVVAAANGEDSSLEAEHPIPPHLASLWEYLVGISEVALWKDVLQSYLKFESTSPPSGSMPTTVRPSEVALWMKRHRKAATPKEVALNNFGPRVLAWWHALQPAWRVPSATSTPATYKRDKEGSLDCLRKGGPTGVILVVIAIGWWIAAHEHHEISPSVAEILEDVKWALSRLGEDTDMSGIDPAEDKPAERPQRGAKRKVDLNATSSKRRRL